VCHSTVFDPTLRWGMISQVCEIVWCVGCVCWLCVHSSRTLTRRRTKLWHTMKSIGISLYSYIHILYIHIHIYIYIYIYICTFTYTYTQQRDMVAGGQNYFDHNTNETAAHKNVHIYISLYTCMYTYTFMYIYIHIHIAGRPGTRRQEVL